MLGPARSKQTGDGADIDASSLSLRGASTPVSRWSRSPYVPVILRTETTTGCPDRTRLYGNPVKPALWTGSRPIGASTLPGSFEFRREFRTGIPSIFVLFLRIVRVKSSQKYLDVYSRHGPKRTGNMQENV